MLKTVLKLFSKPKLSAFGHISEFVYFRKKLANAHIQNLYIRIRDTGIEQVTIESNKGQ